MAQRTVTTEWAFDTLLTTLATNTTLATATRHDFATITLYSPETSGTRTFRSVEVIITARDAETTTARRHDGCRIGITLGVAAANDQDLEGTGFSTTGDHFAVTWLRDVTSYFVSNFGSGASQTAVVGVAFRSDVASLVNNITAKIRMTYEFDDSNTTLVKTVRLPLEGETGYLSTSANTNIRGSAGAAQIPALDTLLPESSKTYRAIYFEVYAMDAGANTTDFTASYAIDSGTNARATMEQALSTWVSYYDIWRQDSLVTSTTHDFQAWSSLASRFERFCVVLVVCYEYAASSTSIFNHVMLSLNTGLVAMGATTSGDQSVWENELYIAEPATITLKQSGILLFWRNGGPGNVTIAVAGSGAAGGTQGTTTSTYTGTAGTISGGQTLCHRIDLAHGGSAITLGRGRNVLRCSAFASVNNAVTAPSGFYLLNYTSGVAAAGPAAHNHTTIWKIHSCIDGAIGGDTFREIATTNQRTPNLPETQYWLNGVGMWVRGQSASMRSHAVAAEVLSGEWNGGDGWQSVGIIRLNDDFEVQTGDYVLYCLPLWKRWPTDPRAAMDIETARKYRYDADVAAIMSLGLLVTYHAIVFSVAGTVTQSAGGTVTINAYRTDTGELIGSTSRVGNGSYSLPWYDSSTTLFVEARESSTLLGRSDNGTAS